MRGRGGIVGGNGLALAEVLNQLEGVKSVDNVVLLDLIRGDINVAGDEIFEGDNLDEADGTGASGSGDANGCGCECGSGWDTGFSKMAGGADK